MLDTSLFSSDYIYDNLFNLSEDAYMELRDLVREDKKRVFRLTQIENEGNDPVESGVSYGTPHDLASMYGRRGADGTKVPVGYSEDLPQGRPVERASIKGTQEDPLGGRDPLGVHGMKGGYPSDNENVSESNVLAKSIYHQIKQGLFAEEGKKLIFEKKSKQEDSLLSERNLKDLEK